MNNEGNATNNGQLNILNSTPPMTGTANGNVVNNVNAFPQMQNVGNIPQGTYGNNFQNNQNSTMNNGVPINNNENVILGTTNNMTYGQTIQNVVPNPQNTEQNPIPLENTDNRFINQNTTFTENNLNELNVNGSYNKMEAPEYVNDPKVVENIQGSTKKTIPITKELKTVILIALILLAFIILMPTIFNLINNIRFR